MLTHGKRIFASQVAQQRGSDHARVQRHRAESSPRKRHREEDVGRLAVPVPRKLFVSLFRV